MSLLLNTGLRQNYENCPKEKGICVDSNGRDQNDGQIKLNSIRGDTEEKEMSCFNLCLQQKDVTGCQVIVTTFRDYNIDFYFSGQTL